jgi:hypothetical protein
MDSIPPNSKPISTSSIERSFSMDDLAAQLKVCNEGIAEYVKEIKACNEEIKTELRAEKKTEGLLDHLNKQLLELKGERDKLTAEKLSLEHLPVELEEAKSKSIIGNLSGTIFPKPDKGPARSNTFKDNLKRDLECDKGAQVTLSPAAKKGYFKDRDFVKMYRCVVLDIYLPSDWVIASHLFPFTLNIVAAELFDVPDIDDEQNGLLLFRPVESAYDHAQLSFLGNNTSDDYFLKLWDQSLKNVPLISCLTEPEQSALKSVLGFVSSSNFVTVTDGLDKKIPFKMNTTFGDIDGKKLAFLNANRPFRRFLNFQARIGFNRHGGQNFEDFWEGSFSDEDAMAETKKKVQDYLDRM